MECCHSLPMGALSQCAHTQTTTELLPQGSTHYAQLRCATCGEHLRFLPKPENVEPKAQRLPAGKATDGPRP